MARFDVYKYSSGVPLLLDIQADILSALKTRVGIPLMPYTAFGKEEASRLKPMLTVKGKRYILVTSDIVTVLVSSLGKKVDNLEMQRQQIIDAVDFLLQGF